MKMNQKIMIPESELEFSFARSSGPGGQNVNKVNSKAILRWNVLDSSILTQEQRDRIFMKLSNRLTKEGDLLVSCDDERDQTKNKKLAQKRLQDLVDKALFVFKKRKKTKISKSVKMKNKESKKRHSDKKRSRRFYD